MSETTEACIRGCALYDQHYTDCEDRDACRGCLPRRARHGHLCWPCHRRLELMLTDAPIVHGWLSGNLASDGSPAPDGDPVTGSKAEPLVINAAIFDLVGLLADRLTLWVDEWVEHKGLTGPGRHSPGVDAEYLLRWLRGVEGLDWVGDWWEELAEMMRDAHALAPWRPTMRRLATVPCPECAECSLVIFGGESDISCLSCRTLIPEKDYGLWELIVKEQRAAS